MQGCLAEVAKFLHESVKKFDYIINDEDETQLLFKEHEKHRKKISEQFFKDVLNLQNVEKFKISKICAIG